MNGFRNWMARLMMGRYGTDELNRFLLIICAILIIIGIFTPRHILNVAVVIILILVYCRMFSRNIGKRQQENIKYLEVKSRVTGGRGGGTTSRPGGYAGPAGGHPGAGNAGSAGSGGFGRKKNKSETGARQADLHLSVLQGQPAGAGRRRQDPHQMPALRQRIRGDGITGTRWHPPL